MKTNRMMQVADWMVRTGTNESTYGNYIFYWEEICDMFHVNRNWLQCHAKEIAKLLMDYEQINEDGVWIGLDSHGKLEYFDCNFYVYYCRNVNRLEYDYA